MSTQTFAPNPFGTPALLGTLGLANSQSPKALAAALGGNLAAMAAQTIPAGAVVSVGAPPSVPAKVPQNERELATKAQSGALVAYLNSRFPSSAAAIAAYVPTFFGSPPPSDGDYQFLHLTFANKASGLNVGLIIDKFSRYPMSPGYVLGAIAAEVGTQIKL